jgi:hypothetical protein
VVFSILTSFRPGQAPVTCALLDRGKMDRGVIVGGVLIAASFLGAMLLNRSANEEAGPAVVAPPPPPLAQGCDRDLSANNRLPASQEVVDVACDSPAAKNVLPKTRIGEDPMSEPPESPLPGK